MEILQHPVHTFAVTRSQQRVIQSQYIHQIGDDGGIGAGLPYRWDNRLDVGGKATGINLKFFPFQRSAYRQHDISMLAGLGHKEFRADHKVHGIQRFQDFMRFREHPVIKAEGHDGLDGIRVPSKHMTVEIGHLRFRNKAVPQWEPVIADATVYIIRGIGVDELMFPGIKVGPLVRVSLARRDIAALGIKVSGDGRKRHNGLEGLIAIAVVHNGRTALTDGRRLIGSVHLGGTVDIIGIQSGDLGDTLQRELLYISLVSLIAVNMVFHIVVVDPIIINDDFCHAKGQDSIGTGANLQVQICQLGTHGSHTGIDDNNLHPAFLSGIQALQLNIFGVVGIGRPAKEGSGAVGIIHREASGHILPGFYGSHVAGAGFGAKIGGTKIMRQPLQERAVPLGIAGKEYH